FVEIGEVGAVLVEVISFWAEVVVDDIQTDSEFFRVRCIDKFLQVGNGAVGVLERKRENAVVSPVSSARELRERHQLDGCYAKFSKIVEVRQESGKRAFTGVRADVQFVENTVAEGHTFPWLIGPSEFCGIDNQRSFVNAFRLKSGGGIGPRVCAV